MRQRGAPGVWEGGGLEENGQSWEQVGPGGIEGVCIIQIGPADAASTSFGSSEEQGILLEE